MNFGIVYNSRAVIWKWIPKYPSVYMQIFLKHLKGVELLWFHFSILDVVKYDKT